ncbi:hypothetical protein PPSIR1_01607 [Plesiocystis pacifica SIR-1]|uniref:Helix-turn-helix domain-containing protein n=1 Tax=Plesiocystis pacifica SIR-1 TaxID=391625 RepID=A6G8H2_9BACT|nr:helix-turn-helix domain-containing protein [Plesiocystis pacifica]EDM77882.1 hypothetical protein PPSIR1_01607 [Plesiocystis pacifica SIR-1]
MHQPSTAVTPEYLEPEDVAALLGVHRKAIYDLAARGEIPGAHRAGHMLRFRCDALIEWFDAAPLTS